MLLCFPIHNLIKFLAEKYLHLYMLQPPIKKLPWTGVLNASQKGDICIQGSNPVKGSEDCLFVQIYIPKVRFFQGLIFVKMHNPYT